MLKNSFDIFLMLLIYYASHEYKFIFTTKMVNKF